MKNIFEKKVADEVIERINQLTSSTQPQWGKMSVDQMLAHCNVTYEMAFEDKHKKPNPFTKLMLKLFVKNAVVNEKAYKRNTRTAPQFLVSNPKNFQDEKNRLVAYLEKTHKLGESYFNGKRSHSFGELTKQEWNNMFYKHLDHHLTQFGV